MAFFDDPKVLIAHLRHSFITSDDTGMCELIMINEDLDKEIKSDHTFSKRSLRLAQRYNPSEHLPRYTAKSYDIQASPTLSRRPPLKDTGNMFEIMEQRKRRKNAGVKVITWQPGVFDHSLFPRQRVRKREPSAEPSALAVLLRDHDRKTANPFHVYSKFNGENLGYMVANTYHIFLPMTKNPLKPFTVSVLHIATVSDLVGLTFWKYIENSKEPVHFKSVRSYAVMIAEEDGDIDTDLPALERDDRVAKFRFNYLGIVEVKGRVRVESQPILIKHIAVKVFYEQGGFSTLALDSIHVDMGEILIKVIKKRRLQIHGYELEKKDSPGVAVDLSSSLHSQGTLDFMLVKNVGRRHTLPVSAEEEEEDGADSPLGRRRVQTSVRAELTSHQYKSYHVVMIHKVRSNTEVVLGVSGEGIEIDSVGGQSRSRFLRGSQKHTSYDIKNICGCEVIDEKVPARTVFRIVRLSKDGSYKNMDVESGASTAKEIQRKIALILEGVSSSTRTGYMEWKEQQQTKTRKPSKHM